MKMNNLLFTALVSVVLTSCMTNSYFQVYKASPSDKLILNENILVYEDENCIVFYDLWAEGGEIGFTFFNKSDTNIYLNLAECFFIRNGLSYNYYRNRVFTHSSSTDASASFGATSSKSVTEKNYLDLFQTNRTATTNTTEIMKSSGNSLSFIEEKIICIPAHYSKIISEYNINESLFRYCDLYIYPTKKEIKTKSFSESESPLVFSNIIAYTVGQSSNIIKFENKFYVTEITNYPESEIYEYKYDEYCGQKKMTTTEYFKNVSPDMFYIKYTQQDTWKH
ncbi:hypothetical protein ACFL6I_25120 [candidate division KSB1 bacterium]